MRSMHTDRDDLEPIEPSRAQQLFLKHKASEIAEKTLESYRYRINHFVRWCDEQGVDDMNDVTGRNLQEYGLWRQEDGDLEKNTLNQQMSTIRVFLKFCGSIEAVPADLHEKVMVPRVTPEDERREETLDAETDEAILEYAARFHYASIEHTLLAVLWQTGIRLGAANSLDVGDVDVEGERIDLVHRVEQGAELENGSSGERPIAITTELATLLEDYITHSRHDVVDEYGREPLFTTSRGRMHRSTLRGVVYRVTAPCFRDEACPDCTGTGPCLDA